MSGRHLGPPLREEIAEELRRTRRCLAALDEALRDCDLPCPLCGGTDSDEDADEYRMHHSAECEVLVRLGEVDGALDYRDGGVLDWRSDVP